MSIKAGDYVVLKKDIPEHLQGNEEYRKKFPLEVKTISICSTKDSNLHNCCKECPGYINDMICFGRSSPKYDEYIVEPILGDWNE